MSRRFDFNITLKNNTPSVNRVNILGNPSFPGFFNSRTKYSWDITGETYAGQATVTITLRRSSQSVFEVYTAPLLESSAQGVVNALNDLNVGSFRYLESGGSTFIQTNNDVYVYDSLAIGTNTITTDITWNNTTVDSGWTLNDEGVAFLTFFGPATGSHTTNNGNTIDGTTFFGPIGATVTINRTLKVAPFTVQLIYTHTDVAAAVAIPPFIIDVNYDYSVTLVP